MNELLAAYHRFAESYYRKNGGLTKEVPYLKQVIRQLKKFYGRTEVARFGPLSLKAVREHFIVEGHSRVYINDQAGRIKRIFQWGVENELVPERAPRLASVTRSEAWAFGSPRNRPCTTGA